MGEIEIKIKRFTASVSFIRFCKSRIFNFTLKLKPFQSDGTNNNENLLSETV